MEDYEIIERIKNGESYAIDQLYNKYCTSAFRTAYLITADKFIAEDVVQETFIQSLKSLNSLKNAKSFKYWFYKILTRTAYKHIKNKRNYVLIDKINDSIEPSANDTYFQDNKYDKLYDEINKLNIKLKTTIILFYFNEMSIKEIAKTMGCFEGTVKSRLYTAKKKLKQVINEEDFIWLIIQIKQLRKLYITNQRT